MKLETFQDFNSDKCSGESVTLLILIANNATIEIPIKITDNITINRKLVALNNNKTMKGQIAAAKLVLNP